MLFEKAVLFCVFKTCVPGAVIQKNVFHRILFFVVVLSFASESFALPRGRRAIGEDKALVCGDHLAPTLGILSKNGFVFGSEVLKVFDDIQKKSSPFSEPSEFAFMKELESRILAQTPTAGWTDMDRVDQFLESGKIWFSEKFTRLRTYDRNSLEKFIENHISRNQNPIILYFWFSSPNSLKRPDLLNKLIETDPFFELRNSMDPRLNPSALPPHDQGMRLAVRVALNQPHWAKSEYALPFLTKILDRSKRNSEMRTLPDPTSVLGAIGGSLFTNPLWMQRIDDAPPLKWQINEVYGVSASRYASYWISKSRGFSSSVNSTSANSSEK